MTWPSIFLAIFGVITAVAAIAVVASKNVIRAALYLVGVLAGAGAIFLVLGAEFLGWTQILVYVGAIVVLLLFGLMLTKAPIGRDILDNDQRWLAFVAAASTFGLFTWLIWDAFGGEEIILEAPTSTEQVGTALFTGFILPFELVSVLLLAALVGAIVLARKDS
jgi:NADH-quinone oxidoreductase subunit J